MIELKEGINYHNFLLDIKPEGWFKRRKDETVVQWLQRISYQPNEKLLGERIQEWRGDSFRIFFAVLSFLRENKMEKETLEELVGFELKGRHDWTISELKKLELYTNIKFLNL